MSLEHYDFDGLVINLSLDEHSWRILILILRRRIGVCVMGFYPPLPPFGRGEH
jgi:hypothetical protein